MSTNSGTETHVIGRAAETVLLSAHMRAVRERRGGSVLIEGEPGIGKTTLLQWFAQEAHREGCRVLQASASASGQRFPLRALLEGLHPQEPAGSGHLASHATRVEQPGPGGAEPPLPSGVADMAQLLRHAAPDTAGVLGADTADVFARPTLVLIDQLIASVTRMTDEGPLILLLDDLHWADESTFLVWQRLGRAAERMPLLIIATSRRVHRRRELDQLRRGLLDRGTRLLSLAPMPPADVEALASDILGAAPEPELRERLVPAAGNPLYVRELLDALRRDDGIDVSAGSARLVGPSLEAEPLPPFKAITERFTFLSPTTYDAVRTASLLGTEFTAAELSAVSGLGPLELLAVFDEAITAGIVTDRGGKMQFRHALIHQALTSVIPASQRAVQHRDAARALAASGAAMERVAQQLLQAGDGADDWAVGWVTAWATPLAGRAPDVAIELLQRLIEHVDADDPRRAPLEARLADAAFHLRRPECIKIVRRLLEHAVAPELRAPLASALAHGLSCDGKWDETLAVIDDAVAATEVPSPSIPPHWLPQFQAMRSLTLCHAGRYAEATSEAQVVLTSKDVGDNTVAEGYARHGLACVLLRERQTESALAENTRGIAACRSLPNAHPSARENREILTTQLVYRAIICGMLDRLSDALDALTEARELCVEYGIHVQLSGISMSRAVLHYWTGNWEVALSDLDAIGDLPTIEWLPVLRYGLAALIFGHRDLGAAAQSSFDELRGRPDPEGNQRSHSSYWLMAGAVLAEREGHLHEALAVLLPTLVPTYARDLDQRYQWMPDVVRLALEAGHVSVAESAVEISETEARQVPLPGRVASAQRCRGLLDKDLRPLLAAAEYYMSAGRPLQAGQTLEDTAAVAAARGEVAAAVEHMNQAIAYYRKVGASWDIKRAEARLWALGVRTKRRGAQDRPSAGWDALTPAELKVALLVAEGWSNPRIAEELYLSPRTVQTHVSHILGKLGVGSRIEVVRVAAERLSR
ncbi:helix-turn-helix transcriptional regulator [Streptomyces sp. NPDC005125]